MALIVGFVAVLLICIVLADTFETMLLPRRVKRQYRLARLFYVLSWRPWAAAARSIRSDKRRSTYLSVFGPLSIIVLLTLWATGLIMGFALLHWSLGTPLAHTKEGVGLGAYAYFSGVTFFTLGYGDFIPTLLQHLLQRPDGQQFRFDRRWRPCLGYRRTVAVVAIKHFVRTRRAATTATNGPPSGTLFRLGKQPRVGIREK